MKHLLAGCCLALALSACGLAPTPAARQAAGSGAVHVIVAAQGGLSLKREGWTEYAPALFGTIVGSSDLLRVDGAPATVACADLKIVPLQAGVNSVPCKVTKPVLTYNSSLIMPTRGEAADYPVHSAPSPDYPQVLSPRKTKVMNARPLIRWTAVQGATGYTVAVRGGNVNWSASAGSVLELAYPESAPALAPGTGYKVTITAGGRSSDEEVIAGLGFTVLKPDEAQPVRNAESRVRALGLSHSATTLLTANVYAGHGLEAEAIELLSAAAQTEPALVRLLADEYLKVGLNRQAEQSYRQALSLSQQASDVEGQAAAQRGLGLIYEGLGDQVQAVSWLQQALAGYQRLGDGPSAAAIQERLTALQKK